jgi:ribose transport system substrate-binding protein
MKKSLVALLLIAAAAAYAQPYQIAVIPKGTSNDYWKVVHAGALKAQQELKSEGVEVKLIWEGPATEDQIDRQQQIVREMIAKHVSGIVISPGDVRALVGPVEAAVQAGIPVVVIDSGLQSVKQLSFVATDNYKGGVLGARQIGKVLEGKGKVILFRARKGAAGAEARETGFLDAIKNQYPGIQVISSDQYAGGTYDSATKSATELLNRLGAEANGVFASNETAAVGMLAALRTTGLVKKIKFVGFDANVRTLEALKAGEMQGFVVQDPMKMGYLGVKLIVDHLKGREVDREVDTGCVMVTADNLEKPAIADLVNPPLAKYLK